MPSFNSVTLIGNVTRDPETRYTPKGIAVTEFALAINRIFKNTEGVKHEEVVYVDLVAWSHVAEIIGQWVRKGDPLFVEGRLQQDQWEDKQTGQKRSRMRVCVNNVQFLARKREGAGRAGESGGDAAPVTNTLRDDDDIPF